MTRKPAPISLDGLTLRARRTRTDGLWYWTGRATVDGVRSEVVVGWMTRDEARRVGGDLIAKGTEKRKPAGPVRTVADLLAIWLGHAELRRDAGEIRASTYEGYRYGVELLTGNLGDVRLEALTGHMVEDALLAMRRTGLAPLTCMRPAAVMRAAHAWGLERGHVTGRPLRVRWAGDTVRPKLTPTAAEVGDAIESLTGWPRAFVCLVAATGARPGEIAALTRDSFAFFNDGWGVARVPGVDGAKTGAASLDLAPWAVAELRAYLGTLGPDAMLWPVSSVVTCVNERLERAGIPWRLYGLRRKLAAELIDAGTSPRDYARVMRHSIETGARSYQSTTPAKARAALERVGAGRPKAGKVLRLGTANGDKTEGSQ